MTPKIIASRGSYMTLGPLISIAGIFISPLASTLSPLLLFFVFRTNRPDAARVALQTADLAFSIQLWIMLISLTLMLGISLDWIVASEAQHTMATATFVTLLIFLTSLLFAIYQAWNGRGCNHIFSFKIGERVHKLITGHT